MVPEEVNALAGRNGEPHRKKDEGDDLAGSGFSGDKTCAIASSRSQKGRDTVEPTRTPQTRTRIPCRAGQDIFVGERRSQLPSLCSCVADPGFSYCEHMRAHTHTHTNT